MTPNTNKRSKAAIPAEMWIYVATDAIARYVGAGGLVVVASDDGPGLVIRLPDVALDDPRLAPTFMSVLESGPVPQVE